MAASNGRAEAELRCHRLLNKVGELVQEGKRDPDQVSRVLQVIKDHADFAQRFFPEPLQPEGLLKDWQRFYKEVWGIKQDFSKLSIPAKQEGFNWPVVMLNGMTARRIVNKMRERMKVWVYDESWLDKVESDREPTKDYVVRFRDRIEADEELKNLSANYLKAKGVNSITLLERLMLELFYYWKTCLSGRQANQHLDISNWTLCAGSRNSDGFVPHVHWNSYYYGWVGVYWCDPGDQDPRLRGRQAVS